MLLMILYIVVFPLVVYSLWQIIGVLVSVFMAQEEPLLSPNAIQRKEAVAFLYLTCNDFSSESCDTLLSQQDVSFHLFILDDSDSLDHREHIDKWAEEKAGLVTVLRRQDRKGFKGGNINNWLLNYADAKKYPFFLVVDSDEKIPPGFAYNLLCAINADAFVQASHSGQADATTFFQRICNLQVNCIWSYEVPARQVFGIAPALGHGILFSYAAVSHVGGFPTVVSEDLGLTIQLATKGKRGRFVRSVVGHEAFPHSYAAYWRRRRRWIQGDTEIVFKFLPYLWRSNVPLAAKVDLTLRETRLVVGSLHWLVLAIVSALSLCSSSSSLALPVVVHLVASIWLIPVLASFFLRGPTFMEKLLFVLFLPFLGMATSSINLLASLAGFMGRAHFHPTGMRIKTKIPAFFLFWETTSGLAFMTVGLISGNYFLCAAGLSIGCSPLMRTKWEVPVLCMGTLVFWVLIFLQIYLDLSNGGTSVLTIAVLIGITLALV